ncbi:hypothetical protein PRK78_004655 [Emydomyces testavorans]|uniref:Uncharacterized protein n=1 Tax=Emydomyces testavorans TaxID=2070801 RepID=A0AAF0IJZ4_9EURO|nr:hypothetical protein PRK78_004655 [Emydomyces testavorans]
MDDFYTTALVFLFVFGLPIFMIKIFFGIEKTFDRLNLYGIASAIRTVKSAFVSRARLDAQTQWIEKMDDKAWEAQNLVQRRERVKEDILEYVATASFEDVKLKNWQKELKDLKRYRWSLNQQRYALHLSKPQGPRMRQYDMEIRRDEIYWAREPVRMMSAPRGVESCKAFDEQSSLPKDK